LKPPGPATDKEGVSAIPSPAALAQAGKICLVREYVEYQ